MNRKKGHVETRKHNDTVAFERKKKMMVIYVLPVKIKNIKIKYRHEDVYDICFFCIKSVHVDDSFCVSSALTSDRVTSIKLAVLRKQKANFTRR